MVNVKNILSGTYTDWIKAPAIGGGVYLSKAVDRQTKQQQKILASANKISKKWSYDGHSAVIDIRRSKTVMNKIKTRYNPFKSVDKMSASRLLCTIVSIEILHLQNTFQKRLVIY